MNIQAASIEIFDNSIGGQYYILEGQKFDINFPIKWAVENLNENDENDENDENIYVGPFHCMNCAIVGAINNVFVGYCSNCALYKYNYSRGNGFNDIGVEQIVDFLGEELNPQNSIWNTYMENVQQDQIGLNIVIIEDEEEDEEGEEEELDNITDVEKEEEEEEEEDYDW